MLPDENNIVMVSLVKMRYLIGVCSDVAGMALRMAAGGRARERANMSYLLFVMLFIVFAVIVLTELLVLEKSSNAPIRIQLPSLLMTQSYDAQGWNGDEKQRASENAKHLPIPEAKDACWQPVGGTKSKFFVYSAYEERRTISAVRVIGATRTRTNDRVWCRVWLANNKTFIHRGRIKAIKENWNLKYSACFILCPLYENSNVDLVDAKVSILSTPDSPPTNVLTVLPTKKLTNTNNDSVTVCVKPLHFNYSQVSWLIEWIELHLILGVNRFIIYVTSMSDQVACVLKYYEDSGRIVLLEWKLNIASKVEIRNQGQFAAFNDCLYRSMSLTDWLLVLDLDEVIFPRGDSPTTLASLFRTLEQPKNVKRPHIAAFLFRNAFFYRDWPDDKAAWNSRLLTMRKTRRWAVPHAVKNRSKYALRPSVAVELGNHFIWEYVSGQAAGAVPIESALLHHYRIACEFGGTDCLKVGSRVDRTSHLYRDALESNYSSAYERVRAVCALPAASSTKASTTTATYNTIVT